MKGVSMRKNLNTKQLEQVEALFKHYGRVEISRTEMDSFAKTGEISRPDWLKTDEYKVSRGVYSLPIEGNDFSPTLTDVPLVPEEPKEAVVSQAAFVVSSLVGNIVPDKDPVFVPWGYFKDIKKIVSSKAFYPIFVTGLSGNGKTMNVSQACAAANRECIRVNVTIETDEDDLLGGYRLQDGQTVWQDGPVIEAMKRGALLLLDEIDLASNKIMCLQPILEGNGVYVKKINKFVKPSAGFNVVATANTKGQGSDDGKFIGTNILNEAFLERFPVTFEQQYPSAKTEQKILNNTLALTGKKDVEYVEKLSTWADVIRKTYFEGGVDEIISTRRLVHIVQAYSIFGNKMKAIELCTNRFDNDTKASFVDLYTKVDAGATAESIAQEQKESALKEQMMSNDSEEDNESEEDFI